MLRPSTHYYHPHFTDEGTEAKRLRSSPKVKQLIMAKHNLSLDSLYSKSPCMAWLFEDEICPQIQRRAKDGNQLTPAGVAVLEVGASRSPQETVDGTENSS